MSLSGVLLVDKPRGLLSARALRDAAKLMQASKAGHGGVLDCLANGLLVALFGEATAFARHILGGDKTYEAEVCFGWRSSSDDSAGVLSQGAPPPPNLLAAARARLPAFVGDITQTAPAYSALKHRGKRLSDYARKGQSAPPKRRRARAQSVAARAAEDPHVLRLRVVCGGGFYVRALARDLGEALGCGAYLLALRRLACGGFNVADATTPAALAALPPERRAGLLLPPAAAASQLPALRLAMQDVRRLAHGAACAAPAANGQWRVLSEEGRFAGVAQSVDSMLRPLRFLHWTREPA